MVVLCISILSLETEKSAVLSCNMISPKNSIYKYFFNSSPLVWKSIRQEAPSSRTRTNIHIAEIRDLFHQYHQSMYMYMYNLDILISKMNVCIWYMYIKSTCISLRTVCMYMIYVHKEHMYKYTFSYQCNV